MAMSSWSLITEPVAEGWTAVIVRGPRERAASIEERKILTARLQARVVLRLMGYTVASVDG
jgi:hypothetical protein